MTHAVLQERRVLLFLFRDCILRIMEKLSDCIPSHYATLLDCDMISSLHSKAKQKFRMSSLEIAPDIGDICPIEKGQNSVLSGETFDLPDILSGGRFLLPQKMSGDKMSMSGRNTCENNFWPPDKLHV